jgi:hypothetical protein
MECPECKSRLTNAPLKINIALRDIIDLINKSKTAAAKEAPSSPIPARKDATQVSRIRDPSMEFSADCKPAPEVIAVASAPPLPISSRPVLLAAARSHSSYVGTYLSQRSSDSFGNDAVAAQSVCAPAAAIQRDQIASTHDVTRESGSGGQNSYVQRWLQQQQQK